MPACGQCPRQVLVTDKLGSISHERRVAKDMIGVVVRVDDVSDRFVGPGADGCEQLQSLANAAARINDRDGIAADDESGIGNGAIVLACHQGGCAGVHEYAGRDFAHRQVDLPRLRYGRYAEHREQRDHRNAMSHVSASISPVSDADRFIFL